MNIFAVKDSNSYISVSLMRNPFPVTPSTNSCFYYLLFWEYQVTVPQSFEEENQKNPDQRILKDKTFFSV